MNETPNCLLFTFCINVFSQNFVNHKSFKTFYLNVYTDTAWVCEYNSNRIYGVLKRKECLLNDPQKPNLLTSAHYLLEQKADGYFLKYRKAPKSRYRSIRFLKKEHQIDAKQVLLFKKSNSIYKLRDSLSGPYHPLPDELRGSLDINPSKSDSLPQYTQKLNFIADSLALRINSLKNPVIDTLHRKIDSIGTISIAEVNYLLQHTDYKFFYAHRLLYKLSQERPQALIDYVAQKPSNQKEVLRTIRWHPQSEEICDNIRAVKISTKARKQIKKQYGRQKLANLGVKATYIGLVSAERALIIALVSDDMSRQSIVINAVNVYTRIT